MADDVTVEFGAKTDGIDSGSAAVKAKLQALQDQTDAMKSGFDSFGSTVSDAFDKAGEGVDKLGDGFKGLNDIIEKGGKETSGNWLKALIGGGIAGGAIAGIITLLHQVGNAFLDMETNAKEASISLERFQELQFALNSSGVGTDKMVSGLQEASKKLNDLSHDSGELGKFLDENNVKWKDATGHIISMDEYLQVAARLIANATTEGDRFKAGEMLGFSREWVRVLQDGPVALRQAAEEAHRLGVVLDAETIHKAADFEAEWKKSTTVWAEYFKSAIIFVTPYIQKLVDWLGLAVSYVAKIAKDLGAAITEDFKEGFRGLIPDNFESRFSAVNDAVKGFAGGSIAAAARWQEMVNDASQMSKDVARLGAQTFPSKGTTFPGKDDADSSRSAFTALYEELDKIKDKYAQTKILEQISVESFKETETQKVAHLQAALEQRRAAEVAVYDKLLTLAKDDADKTADINRKKNKAMEADDLESLKLRSELIKKNTQEWESSLGAITSAFNSQLRGLLAGTTSWSQAMKNIAGDLVIKMIEEFEKLAIVKPLSGMLASAMSAPTELFAGLIKMISGMFGPLMAGFTSFFAPTQGPAAPAEGAAAAAATVAAATATVASLDVGTDYVPKTGLALIHQGEAIVPASQNPAAGGTPLAGASFSFNVTAMDAASVQRFFSTYAPQIARILTSHMNLNPSFSQS